MSGGEAKTWRESAEAKETSVYDWCWVCGLPLGPDKMHVMIPAPAGLVRHTYACRKHRYVMVRVMERQYRSLGSADAPMWHDVETWVRQERTDHEIEALAWAFRAGTLEPGWE